MAGPDIVARLQLRAEDFSSTTGKAFADMETRAKSAASQVKDTFGSSFAEVQRIASTAVASGGKIDFSSELAGLRESATAAEQKSVALRALAVASAGAVTAERADAEALRLDADAARVGALAADQAALAYRRRISSLEAVRAQLGDVAVLEAREGAALVQVTGHTGNATAAKMLLQHAIRSSADSFAAGLPPMMIFGEQIGRVGEAAALAGGSLGVVGKFLGGPWGIAITAGLAVLTPLVTKLFESGDAADKGGEALKKQADAAKSTEQAIKDLNETLGKNIQSQQRAQFVALANAEAQRQLEIHTRLTTKAELDALRQSVANDQTQSRLGTPDTNREFRLQNAPALLNDLNARSAAQEAAIKRAEQSVRLAQIPIIQDRVRESSDKAAAAQGRFNRAQDLLNSALKAGKIDVADYQSKLADAQRTLDATTKSSRGAGNALGGDADVRARLATATTGVAKAEAELAIAQRELASDLSGVISAFDPARAAGDHYADTLAKIAKLRAAGKLTPDQAVGYSHAAALKEIDEEAQADEEKRKNFLKTLSPELADAFTHPLAEFTKVDLKNSMRAAGQAGGEAFQQTALQAAQELSRALNLNIGGGTGGFLSGAFSLIAGTSQQTKDAIATLSGSVASLAGKGLKLDANSVKGLSATIGQGLGGAVTGQQVNSVFAPIGKALGLKTSKTGAEIGGAIGSFVHIPGGQIIGSIVGSVVGGLFKKTKTGYAHLTSDAAGGALVSSTGGNSASRIAASKSEGTAFGQQLQQIAQALGGTVTGGIQLGSLGVRDKKNYFDPTPGTKADRKSYASAEEAENAALTYALNKGVISGISEASKRILASGQDLQTAIQKAVTIEGVPKQLKAMLDPVGAAIDDLNTKFKATVDALTEGGATADQMAQAQQLYNLQLEQVKASTDSASQALKDFQASLKVGGSSPLSLRDQETAAKSALQPYLDAISSGQAIDQGKYQTSAQSYLDVERQLYGSTDDYFKAFDQIQAATTKAIEKIDNVTPIGASVADPFAQATADATQTTASNTQTATEILSQQTDLLNSQGKTLQQILAALGTGDTSFIGAARSFAA